MTQPQPELTPDEWRRICDALRYLGRDLHHRSFSVTPERRELLWQEMDQCLTHWRITGFAGHQRAPRACGARSQSQAQNPPRRLPGLPMVVNRELPPLHLTTTRTEQPCRVHRHLVLPGCYTQGKSRDEVLGNIREAIQLWLEVEAEEAGVKTVETLELAD